MRYSYYLFLVSCLLLISCEDNEVAWVSIQNNTAYFLDVELISNPNANHSAGTIVLDTLHNREKDIYHSVDEGISPCKLLSQGYDSIIIYMHDPNNTKIYIGKNSVKNYALNPFKHSQSWDYVLFAAEFPDMRDRNVTIVHNHVFSIETKSLINEIAN